MGDRDWESWHLIGSLTTESVSGSSERRAHGTSIEDICFLGYLSKVDLVLWLEDAKRGLFQIEVFPRGLRGILSRCKRRNAAQCTQTERKKRREYCMGGCFTWCQQEDTEVTYRIRDFPQSCTYPMAQQEAKYSGSEYFWFRIYRIEVMYWSHHTFEVHIEDVRDTSGRGTNAYILWQWECGDECNNGRIDIEQEAQFDRLSLYQVECSCWSDRRIMDCRDVEYRWCFHKAIDARKKGTSIWRVDVLVTLSNWIPSLEPNSRGPNKGDCAIACAYDHWSLVVVGIIWPPWKLVDETMITLFLRIHIDLHYHPSYLLLRKSTPSLCRNDHIYMVYQIQQ